MRRTPPAAFLWKDDTVCKIFLLEKFQLGTQQRQAINGFFNFFAQKSNSDSDVGNNAISTMPLNVGKRAWLWVWPFAYLNVENDSKSSNFLNFSQINLKTNTLTVTFSLFMLLGKKNRFLANCLPIMKQVSDRKIGVLEFAHILPLFTVN